MYFQQNIINNNYNSLHLYSTFSGYWKRFTWKEESH